MSRATIEAEKFKLIALTFEEFSKQLLFMEEHVELLDLQNRNSLIIKNLQGIINLKDFSIHVAKIPERFKRDYHFSQDFNLIK